MALAQASKLRCMEERPDDPQVMRIRDEGYLVEMRQKTLPLDCQEFLRDASNDFHDGVGMTLQEMLEKVPDIEASWHEQKTDTTRRAVLIQQQKPIHT